MTKAHNTKQTTAHTPEPWEHDGNGLIYSMHVKEEGGTATFVCDVTEDSTHAALCGPTPEEEVTAGRIVAAVNACVGISTEALEQGAVAEILQQLKLLADHLETRPHDLSEGMRALRLREARATIARATGRAA